MVARTPGEHRGHRWSVGTWASLPCATALAATWNRDLVRRVGGVLADEARAKGAAVLLRPTSFRRRLEDSPAYPYYPGHNGVVRCVRDPASAENETDPELRDFTKFSLDAGQTPTVTFDLPSRAFAHWDPLAHSWTVRPGEREILVESSSRDIRETAHVISSSGGESV